MRSTDLPTLGRRRQRRRVKQRGYSQNYRDKLADAKCPDRDDIAAAAIRVAIELLAVNKPIDTRSFLVAIWKDLAAKGFSEAAGMEKFKSMIVARRRQIARKSGNPLEAN
ncbi:hypothetical protein [Bosea sp. (in: a-proteobacteria)]|uniref:hypothetical protein n=1 Tax=Bosea sp. (in: a-proteobacteria) TaxID=1871050 RepID=UPI0011FD4FE5|nr:hypothetical protein [Bosea sp. (in: a-proteobacteria)]TAJ33375.1 MAG: hypothetical protein EPO59_05255 [Bosea sp. (in: a-proteobacteria)]